MKGKRILFIGGTPRGLELMKLLVAQKVKVVHAFILKEDEHEPLKVSAEILALCRKNKIPATVTKKIEKDQTPAILKLKPEVAFVCGWRSIIFKDLYQSLPLGCLAAHDSLLPKYRGFAPTAWAIINGETETGVTLFKIDHHGIDAGDIFAQKRIPIGAEETATDVYPRIIKASIELYGDFLKAWKENKIKFHPQNAKEATFAAKRTPADGEINWNKSAQELYNFIRALQPPYPYAWTILNGKKISVVRAKIDAEKLAVGESKVAGKNILVGCKDGSIKIEKILNENNQGEEMLAYIGASGVS